MKQILLLIMLFSHQGWACCWKEAGARYGIEPELIQAIALVESSGNAKAINVNNNGSIDVGLMQINSDNWFALSKFNITSETLINDPCINVMSGTWILAGFMRKLGYSWDAVGAYNAGLSKSKAIQKKIYIKKVQSHYRRLKAETFDK